MPKESGEWKYSRRACQFVYEGGPYIDIKIDGKAIEVINVWDYEENRPTIHTRAEFLAECEAWLKATSDEEMREYRIAARTP